MLGFYNYNVPLGEKILMIIAAHNLTLSHIQNYLF